MAACVRRRFLPRFVGDVGSARRLARWVLYEWMIARALVLVAVQLARTVPAAHDAIEWPLPFRLSIDANANTIWISTSLAGLAVATAALVFSALRLFRVRHFSA